MTLEKERRTIGVFAKCSDAQVVLQDLKASNFPMHKVSVIARNAEEQSNIASVEVKEYTGNISSEDAVGAVKNADLGAFTGLLTNLALWVIPGIGQVILAGVEATAIATTLASSLPTLLLNLGISERQVQGYSDLVCKGYYLVIVTGIDTEIRLVKKIINGRNIHQWDVYEPYSTPNSRYKHALGIFYSCQDAKRALAELTTAGFPMSQVSMIAKNTSNLSDIFEVDISGFQDNYTNLGISDELARYYKHHLNLDRYLVVLKGTDIYIAGARAILESNKIQHFSIYSPSELDTAISDRQITTSF
ncbi:hypothetical protein ANSO36C_60540 [Nostoc cf. commune SO-36]|uniref:Uncharacterized protein n=1 Tax=Nostoc cf. commune SO-36 TaxID=449208 RepID=A0ABN6QE71_NOSCO|nr:hypothetical protein [Nostoc commune]BDI20252.1 hypothetical protein ANSO36C_60540 [Nostoc cf. commune SO-36]